MGVLAEFNKLLPHSKRRKDWHTFFVKGMFYEIVCPQFLYFKHFEKTISEFDKDEFPDKSMDAPISEIFFAKRMNKLSRTKGLT